MPRGFVEDHRQRDWTLPGILLHPIDLLFRRIILAISSSHEDKQERRLREHIDHLRRRRFLPAKTTRISIAI